MRERRPGTADPTGRHRRARAAVSGVHRAVDVIARVGNLVALAALLVLAATAGGVADGVPAGSDATITATFERADPGQP